MKFGLVGAADITGILPSGVRLEIEVKSGNAKQSQEQKNFETMIQRHGGIYFVARSLDDVLRVLNP
jgi:hypothetical protein